ncbi:thioredoxin-interacting protein-like isoform X2 [Pristis pectinata]|uniref:thioredoxin-interacting protein-like isoform X2 n=1 Tax=Pristis pectinata TaxID=685728 RepID=UPI00223D65B6|nr:thioredoxin-interacting protein-like isoform X2 [Pristis pectinata]
MGVTKTPLQIFEVQFNGSQSSYSAGDKVSGRVRLQAAHPLRVDSVRIEALGYARAELSKGSQPLRQQQEYLRHRDTLVADGEGRCADVHSSMLLQPGKVYEYSFNFQLPEGRLPPSFKGKYGGVCYLVTAYVDQEKLPSLQVSRNFEVVDPIDVNTPSLLSPVGGSNKKNLTCFFLADGYVCIAAKIDRKGYCQGDDICINAQFQNNCSRIIVPKAAILSKQTYLVNGSTKVVKEKLNTVRGNHIISGMSDSWCGKSLRVPTVKPSIDCSIIRLEYSLLIYVHIPGSKKLILDLPLVIGTIPYSGMDSRSSSMASNCSMSSSSMSCTSMSWPHMEFPESMSTSSFVDNHRMECPTTPLLDEYDGVPQSPIFMKSLFDYSTPPAYSEVDENGNSEAAVQ